MTSLKTWVVAGALLLASSAAFAADVPMEPVPVAPAPVAFGGWYLRGDIGFSNQQVDKLDNVDYANVDNLAFPIKDFDAAPFGGLGIGYQFNKWFRVDVTGEYRGKATFHGMDTFSVGNIDFGNEYSGSKSEWTGLLNGYVDLGDWYGFSPFVGAGIGFSHNTISNLKDSGISTIPSTSLASAEDGSETNFAWALMAGLGYHVTPNMTVEAAYRYINLGDAESGDLVAYDGTCQPCTNNPLKFKDLTSNDFRLGVRWLLGPPQ
jgi:opacity protein-like surface antigen